MVVDLSNITNNENNTILWSLLQNVFFNAMYTYITYKYSYIMNKELKEINIYLYSRRSNT